MTFGYRVLIIFHVFSGIRKNVTYNSPLMYFVVLGLQKVTKNRYMLVKNFMFFRDLHFYLFLIDFGCPWGLQKWSLGATGARPGPKRVRKCQKQMGKTKIIRCTCKTYQKPMEKKRCSVYSSYALYHDLPHSVHS